MDDITNDLIKAQSAAERLALVVSAYYTTLLRENVPDNTAQLLTLKLQADLLARAFFAPGGDDPQSTK